MATDPKYDDLPAHLRHAKSREAEEASDESGGHRAALIPMGLGLLLVAGLSGWQFVQSAQPIPIQSQPPRALTADGTRGHTPPSQGDPLQDVYAGASISQMLHLTPHDAALDHEPADLPSYPGAVRIAGFSRTTRGTREEVAIWRIPAAAAPPLSEATDYYVNAAEQRGFETVGRVEPGTARQHGVLIRTLDGDEAQRHEVLSLSTTASTRSAALRVVIWLRTPVDPDDAAGD